ncbi:hypothetical protein RND71_017169 [Anisodus tanguticus]|uniref:Uncharacterized protein n=1 Tax=Anisodus tanguticus TaxID=243964 RepID=A0AAE1V9S3_9SOLA|nr:hypothetical protein RND71_017169 [Anisodus tanguticus]
MQSTLKLSLRVSQIFHKLKGMKVLPGMASYLSSATRDIPAQTTPSFPEVAVENTATVSKADVVLNANATELETRCDQSGALPTKEKVVDSVHPEPKHQSVPTNHSVLGVENRNTYTLKQLLQMLMQQNRKP